MSQIQMQRRTVAAQFVEGSNTSWLTPRSGPLRGVEWCLGRVAAG